MPDKTTPPSEQDAVELQHKLEECAARHRAAIDVVATLLVAQFPALLSASETFSTFAAWLN